MADFAWARDTEPDEILGQTRPSSLKKLLESSRPVWVALYESWLTATGLGGDEGPAALGFLRGPGGDKALRKQWMDYLGATYQRFYDDVGLLKSHFKDGGVVEAGGESHDELVARCDQLASELFEALSPESPAEATFIALVDLEEGFPTDVDWVQGVIDSRYQEVLVAWGTNTKGTTALLGTWRTVRPQLIAIVDAGTRRTELERQVSLFEQAVEGVATAVARICELAAKVADDFLDKLNTAIRLNIRENFEKLHPTAARVLNVINKAALAASVGMGLCSLIGIDLGIGALLGAITLTTVKLATFATREIMIQLDSHDDEQRAAALERIDVAAMPTRTREAVEVTGGVVGAITGFVGAPGSEVLTEVGSYTVTGVGAAVTGVGLGVQKLGGYQEDRDGGGPSGQELWDDAESNRSLVSDAVEEAGIDFEFLGRGKDPDELPYSLGWSGGYLVKQWLDTAGDRVAGYFEVCEAAWAVVDGEAGWFYADTRQLVPSDDHRVPPPPPEDEHPG